MSRLSARMPRRARVGDGLAAALKSVVKSAEMTLGEVIAEAAGQDLFDVVEAVRLDMVAVREGDTRALARARRRRPR